MTQNLPISLNRDEIEEILPQSGIFLFPQKGVISQGENEGEIIAYSETVFQEDFLILKGHFGVVPGVILQEILGQTASLILKAAPQFQGLIGMFTGADAKYRGVVKSGDVIESEVKININNLSKKSGRTFGAFTGVGKVNGKKVITMTANFVLSSLEEENQR